MDENEILIFAKEFNDNVKSNAKANNLEMEEAFTDYFCDYLTELGEVDLWYPSSWLDKNIGAKVDGYYLEDDDETLNLIISMWKDWNGEEIDDSKVINSEVDKSIKRIRKFITSSLSKNLPGNRIDLGHPAYDLAELIYELKDVINKFRIIIVTDGIAPTRLGESIIEDGIEIDISLWDMRRLFNIQERGERKGIDIDFNDYGGPVPFVSEKAKNGYYTSYLGFLPGSLLADLYAKHKTRLLERNVRVFLSERVKVNKGISNTIQNEPSMMGAYNNGLTIYADELETKMMENGLEGISMIKDFQIVNGGQTTASLFHTRRKHKVDLEEVFLQMKVMVIHESAKPIELDVSTRLSDVLVPKIGNFSNSQNAIKPADLSSNETPHPEINSISLNYPAPDVTGGTMISYWYYENKRGSWNVKKRLEAKTSSQKKKFDLMYPKSQSFDKGKFAKVWYSYRGKPDIVSKGPAKCFADFNSNLLKEEIKYAGDHGPTYWVDYFQKTVALRIIWLRLEKEIGSRVRQLIYSSYKQNLTAYTIAVFGEKTNGKFDLKNIWNEQKVPDELFEWLMDVCDIVHQHIVDDLPKNRTHVTEWCKSEECWDKMKESRIFPKFPNEMRKLLLENTGGARIAPNEYDAAREWCISKGHQAWYELYLYLKDRDLMANKQQSQCRTISRLLKGNDPKLIGGKTGRRFLSMACKEIWEQAEEQYKWES